MNVRIGIADAAREVELDVDEPADLEAMIEKAFAEEAPLLWVEDTKARRIGIPVARIAYVEISAATPTAVGFG